MIKLGKTCTRCNNTKIFAEFISDTGRQLKSCNMCREKAKRYNDYQREYRKLNKPKPRIRTDYQREYRKANKEKLNENSRRYSAKKTAMKFLTRQPE